MKNFASSVRHALELAVKQHGTQKALADAAGVNEPNISRWLKGRDPRVSEISPVLDLIGATLSFPSDTNNQETPDILALHGRISELEKTNGKLERANAKLEGAVEALESQLDKFRDQFSSVRTSAEDPQHFDKGAA